MGGASNTFPSIIESDDDESHAETKDVEMDVTSNPKEFVIGDELEEDEDSTTEELAAKQPATRTYKAATAAALAGKFHSSVSSSSSSSLHGSMTNPSAPPQTFLPSLHGNLSAADIVNMKNLQIPHAVEAYYMQTRQMELETIYSSFADLHEVYDSLSINEWIDILSCIRGLNASGLLNKLRRLPRNSR